jgi:hypothetical protein
LLDRSVADLPSLLVRWLAYTWGATEQANPLRQGHGVPSAAMVEALYGLAGVDLTPGLAAAASCPEAIWQAAIWWGKYYKAAAEGGPDGVIEPEGVVGIRQRAASVTD